jgi:hypothetical protein
MSEVVNILLRLPRESQDPRIQQIIAWYDQRPIGPKGRHSNLKDHLVQALSVGLSNMEYGGLQAPAQTALPNEGTEAFERGSEERGAEPAKKTGSRFPKSKPPAMKKIAANMKF